MNNTHGSSIVIPDIIENTPHLSKFKFPKNFINNLYSSFNFSAISDKKAGWYYKDDLSR